MRKGFTLIELLMVVVIIGIIAALVLPKFGDVKRKAYISAMKSDLRNFATAQEIYFDANGAYATGQITESGAVADFTSSKNVTIDVTTNASGDSYTAVAHNSQAAGATCTLELGVGKLNKVTCEGEDVSSGS